MFLNYLALALLIIGTLLLFYTFIFIHDLPYKIALKRNHPNAEAIHVACWLSLFTFHVFWPLVYIWAVARQDTQVISFEHPEKSLGPPSSDSPALAQRLAALEARLAQLEKKEES